MEELLDRAEILITEGNYVDAQTVLDGIEEKNARWHYIQSKIYYNQHWTYESRNQLKIAVKLDPDNVKYKEELEEQEEQAKETQRKYDKENKKMKKRLGEGFWGECASAGAQGGCECCALCCCEGLCSLLCNG